MRRYASNPVRQGLTEWTKVISQVEIVVDKMHMAGHVDNWCKEMCDPHKFRDLDKVQYVYRPLHFYSDMLFLFLQVDTEVCEQCFSWLSRYARMTRRMSRNTFMFFLLYM